MKASSDQTVTVLTLRRGTRSVTLHLHRDPGAQMRALARASGHALSHVGRQVSPELSKLVHELGRVFSATGNVDAPTAAVVDRLAQLVADLAPDAVLETTRGSASAQPLPKWSAALRAGTPRAETGGLWPFDPELVALELGLRRAIKRETLYEDEAELTVAWLESRGLVVRRAAEPAGDGQLVILAAASSAAVDHAFELETSLSTSEGDEAARELGLELGYPECCVRAFVELGLRDDAALLAALLPPLGAPPAPPEAQWLAGPLAIVSHAPCSLECAPTLGLARRVLAELDRRHPGFAERWRELAARVQLIDQSGSSRAWDVEGALERGAQIRDAVKLLSPSGSAVGRVVAPDPELAGRRIVTSAAELVSPVRARFVADHRAASTAR